MLFMYLPSHSFTKHISELIFESILYCITYFIIKDEMNVLRYKKVITKVD